MPAVRGGLHVAKVHQYAAAIVGSDTSPLHGDCVDPVFIEYRGCEDEVLHRLREWQTDEALDYAPGHGWLGEFKPAMRTTAYVSVRCRKCGPCLKARARVWATRGAVELKAAERSWFGTLTFRPDERFRLRCLADAKAESSGSRWFQLDDAEQFKAIASVIRSDHWQRFMKRVRKASRARVRYLMTTEAHADGFPHLHLLLHEYEGRVTKRTLEQQWPHGVSHWRLVNALDHNVPWYVAKYLTKSILAKPVASLRYGQPPLEASTERIRSATRAVSAALAANRPEKPAVPEKRGGHA